ncbi:rhamnogalacturonan acetylesterase [Luteolibacter arcticus]|uniref:Rhamnogalacturonan acetylesterase n=1 Tax=Luteolibacter arcticus TaxID=1581411 RepID=A0ABT3GME2_9BACT|nr:rhamnogalacturonan acetylesterase [Luteolibacter arcticus]MCW1924678.1 rhamnogalacturonan acetylesterase [Luteolibacter arcticus]
MRLPLFLVAPLLALPLQAGTGPWKFDFGGGKPAAGFTAVHASDRYEEAKGFGFDLVGKPVEEADHVTGAGGYFFSLAVPEGCYEVTVVPAKGVDLTVKSESRRLMLEAVRETSRFTVHVRQPAFPGGAVKLKDREKPYLHWDNKITLEFNGPKPDVDRVEIRVVEVPVIHVLGDSTVTDQSKEPWNSWGQMLPRFFGPGVAVANHAESGESIRSSLGAKRFEKVYRSMKKGDYVLVQFGHNDMKDKRPDALETYRSNLASIVKQVRELGGTPVLITSMERKGGVKSDTLGGYPDAVRSVAKEMDVALVDLHAMSRTLYQALGDKVGAAFQDGTHHNNYGSYELAKCVVEGIRTKIPELAKQLRPEVTRFDPAKPDKPEDFHYPASPMKDLTKPDGD